MKNFIQPLLVAMLLVVGVSASQGREVQMKDRGGDKGTPEKAVSAAAGCSPSASFEFLEINNVRARFNTGGDMWWDFSKAAYFIPAKSTKTSLFASALWIGGVDVNNQLKFAGQRFRQIGIDFWTGPLSVKEDGLDKEIASIKPEVCAAYDKMFRITKEEVLEFIGWFTSNNKEEEYPNYTIPPSIRNWPAHPYDAPLAATYLAPFFDRDGDGEYNPDNGDYPYYDFDNTLCPLNYAGVPGWTPEPTMGTKGTLFDPVPTEVGGILSDQVIHGDETLWWVFNDKGNAHTETKGEPIGLEIRAHAFAFSTNDEINNMSFLSYEIINRSTFTLTETFFGVWVDPDLGYPKDDYLGCDVARGLAYCYNGKDIDGSGEPEAYGANPPAVGVDFFQGPYMDPDGYDNPGFRHLPLKGPSFFNWDNPCQIVTAHNKVIPMSYGIEPPHNSETVEVLVRAEAINGVNFGNGIVDDERFGMRRFMYFNNEHGPQGDPDIAPQYYQFLRGIWGDGSRLQYGGTGFPGSSAQPPVGPECDFAFPGDSDPCNWGTGGQQPNDGYNTGTKFWTEEQCGNTPEDRRTIQSAGPFTLKPGAVNYITVGIPWARANKGKPYASVELLKLADDKCQALFENCFKVIDGPDAPDLSFIELDKKLICLIDNAKTSNNYLEGYSEVDNTINEGDSLFRFEGYQIYQVVSNKVGPEELTNTDKARLIAQYDIANGIGRIINFERDDFLGFDVPVEKVSGNDLGIQHSFEITVDQFPIGKDNSLVNNRHYYYMAIAYAYNNYKQFYPDSAYLGGQKKCYLSGRNNIKVYTVMPHKTVNGLEVRAEYGDIPQITRIEGQGNGGINIDLTDETIDHILSKPMASATNIYGMDSYPIAYEPTYKVGRGPIMVKVIDPLRVQPNDYKLRFVNCTEKEVKYARSAYQKNDPVKYIDSYEWILENQNGEQLATSHEAVRLTVTDTAANPFETPIFKTKDYEQLLLDLGISIHVSQVLHPGDYFMQHTANNGFIEATVHYADSSRQWVSGFPDVDDPESPMNWIKSGTQMVVIPGGSVSADQFKSDFDVANKTPWDPFQAYEKIQGGIWAPIELTGTIKQGTQALLTWSEIDPITSYAPNFARREYGPLNEINSVNIVMTPNKDLWTRCLVIEQSWDNKLSENGAARFLYRKAKSVDKEGRTSDSDEPSDDPNHPNYLSAEGMGWFPGYAINVETGERMNIMFGENSYMLANNGRDMIFNPTARLLDDHGSFVFGGMHYVYVLGSKHTQYQFSGNGPFLERTFPAYDGCKTIKHFMDTIFEMDWSNGVFKREILSMIYGSCQYVGMPCPAPGYEDKWLDNEYTLKIRVMKPYERYYTSELPTEGSKNDHWPMYSFTTKGLDPVMNETAKVETDLDLINVVPNPYYAYSSYENNPTDNRIRITNLPQNCTVTIYNMGGAMIRQFKKSSSDPNIETYLDWDLKNFAGVPISGGVYLIHVRNVGADGKVRDRVIKWFGVIRTVDLFTF